MKFCHLLLFAVLVLAACDGSNSPDPASDVSERTFTDKGDLSTLDAPPPHTITELPPVGNITPPAPLPEVGEQFLTSPTGVPYAKLATLYPGHLGPMVDDGMILPWLSKRAPLRFKVNVQTAMDTDGDGKLDRIALRIVQPAEVAEGLKTPVVVRPSIYYEDPEYLSKRRAPFLGEDQYIRMGFTVVYADSLGSNESEGCPSIMDATERQAMADVARWLTNDPLVEGTDEKGDAARASWSTDHIAMEGISYGGTLSTMATVMEVPGLEANVTVDGISNAYDYFARYNGVVPNDDASVSLTGFVLSSGTVRDARRSICAANQKKLEDGVDNTTLAYNDFWKERNTLVLAGKIKAATLIAHGQSDNNVKTKNGVQLYDTLYQMKKPVQLWFHSRNHDDPVWQKEWQKEILLWYSRYLYGVNNGVEKQPTYVRETPAGDLIAGDLIPPSINDKSNTLVGHCDTNRTNAHSPRDCIPNGELLVKEDAWPKTEVVSYYLRQNSPAPGLLLTPNAGDGTTSTPVSFNGNGDSGVFETQALLDATRFAGTIKVAMMARFLDGVPYLKATLLVDGKRVTWGWANPRFYKGLEKQEMIAMDTYYPISLEMMPRDFTVLPGSKISLRIEGYRSWESDGAKQTTLDLSQTTLDMPLVPRAHPAAVMTLN